MSCLDRIDSETHQIENAMHRHMEKMDPDLYQLVQTLCKNIRYETNKVREANERLTDYVGTVKQE